MERAKARETEVGKQDVFLPYQEFKEHDPHRDVEIKVK